MKRFMCLLCFLALAVSAHAKQARTYYTDAKIAAAREKVASQSWAKGQEAGVVAASERYIKMSDQELWNFIPPPEQLRALNTHFGADCPVHGTEIHRVGGHYPWQMSPDRPFKVKCPVGGEEYPSNDFQPWNMASCTAEPEKGPGYVDKGAGWVDAKGTRYFFVGCYVFWQRWQAEVIPAVRNLSLAYLLTGKPIYAHKCAVMLSKLAADYERFDYPTQSYHNGSWPARINGRILDYIWTTGYTSSFSLAYDAIYPALTQDAELTAFLKGKGVEDARQHIERKMLVVMAKDIMRGFVRGNMGMHQSALATLAVALDNQDEAVGPTTKQMRDWIMTGEGDSEYLLWNGFYRDGHGGESSPGYSAGWVTGYYEVARLLPLLGLDIWKNPKIKKMADIELDLTVAGKFWPSIGDSGTIFGSTAGRYAGVLGPAFTQYHDPRYARALVQMGAQSENLWDVLFDPAQVQAAAAKADEDLGLKTRNLGGYGLAVLESGSGANRRGVSMYYGHSGGGHGHLDRLTYEMFDFDRPVLTDMGYPAHWLPKATYWTNNTVSHYGVVVNETWQQTSFAGHLNTLASAPGVQLADASAENVAYPGVTSLYRRSLALVDLGAEHSYLLDIFRVRGGFQHDYSFHGPPFPEFTVSGGTPGATQTEGTLAGVKVPFAGIPPTSSSAGLAVNLRQGAGILSDSRPYDKRSDEGWSTYYSGDETLTRKVGATLICKLPEPVRGKVKVFLRAYDYNVGANTVDITLGDQTQACHWEPSGQVGYRWLSRVFDLPKDVSQITLTAKEAGQAYILLASLVLSSDLQSTEPRVWDSRTSGFQYLFNIRRMKPQGAWSATWRKPDEDLAITTTMPAGCAGEIILADAEAELKPGHPKTLQYFLARNQAGSGKDLGSTFVTVTEPHKGAAQISAVKRLRQAGTVDGAVGLEIAHGATTDLVHSALNTEDTAIWEGGKQPFSVAGEFAAVTLDDQGVKQAVLVNGTVLRCGDLALKAEAAPAGKVLSVDFATNSIVIDAPLKAPRSWQDHVAILGNELHQTSYTVKNVTVEQGRTVLNFGDTLYLVGMAKATGVDQAKGTVATDTTLAGYGRVDGGQHQGRWLYNEDKTQCFRIAKFAGGQFFLENVSGDLNAIYKDSDGDGLRRLWISDLGPGDRYRLPTTTYVYRVRPGQYEVRLNTDAALTVPQPK